MKSFALAHFLSAFLLFLIEPVYAKRFLPLLGGSVEVWNTCMLAYQSLLLAGYFYVYLIADRWKWSGRRQVIIQVLLLLLPLFLILLGQESTLPPPTANPVSWLLFSLLLSAGPPFFILSTTTPLLQRWLSSTEVSSSADPYFLYSASNCGSIMALIAYPTLIERFLTLEQQQYFWIAAYVVFVFLMGLCGKKFLAYKLPFRQEQNSLDGEPSPNWQQRLHWLALAFVPSSLLLSVTAYLETNIAPFPLLWIIPLGLYLLSLIIVFARRSIIRYEWCLVVQLPIIISLAVAFYWETVHFNYSVMFPWHLLVFFITAMVCHGQLAQSRPSVRYLTEFYLLMAFGGALGAGFNTLIAPVIFNSLYEYPLILACSLALRPGTAGAGRFSGWFLDLVVSICLLGTMAIQRALIDVLHEVYRLDFGANDLLFVVVPGAVILLAFWRRPLVLSLTVLSILAMGATYWPRDYLYQGRNFYGVITVEKIGDVNFLTHGDILHGAEKMTGPRPHEPLTYYHETSPIGQFFKVYKSELAGANIAIVGLGAGTLAAYAQPGQHWTFYEINAQVFQVASDSRYFTYLSDCRAPRNVVIGDGRLSLRKAPDRNYALIVFDAFSSDAIPIHMLTREAIQLYLSKLAPHGVLAFHISTKSVDLIPILRALTKDAHLTCVAEKQPPLSSAECLSHRSDSTWVFIARDQADFEPLKKTTDYNSVPDGPNASVWTDQFSDMIGAIRF